MGDHSEEEIRQRKMTAYGSPQAKESDNEEAKTAIDPQKSNNRKSYITIYLPKKLVYLSILVAIIAAVIIYVPRLFFLFDNEDPFEMIGREGAALFRRYDRDGDDHLSISEYEALYHQLVGKGLNITEIEYIPEQEIKEDDQYLTLRAYFSPLLLDTMTKDMAESHLFAHMESLNGLKEWTAVNHEWLNFGVEHFSVFFPVNFIGVGQIYELYTDGRSSLMSSLSSSHLSSNRFYPTKPDEKLIVIHRILSMFHPRPFLVTRFPPKGGVAMVRAVSEEFIDIVFRVHAEFQLNEPPYNPFWFTPAQFTGNIIVTKDYKHIVYFNVYVPSDKKLNVDMEWLNGPSEGENMEVDIGYMPLMQANISAPSREWKIQHDIEYPVETDSGVQETVQGIKWLEEIDREGALRQLEVKMYPFKQVRYYNFTETLTKAKEENKLIHSILLWGALDDQSC